MANISGAMMIEATVPIAQEIFATPWLFYAPLILAGAVPAAIICLWRLFQRGDVDVRRLLPVGLLNDVFTAIAACLFHTS